MANINLISFSTRRHPQGVFQIKGIQAHYANLGMHHPHSNEYNTKILQYIKLISIKLQFDIKTT
jgi:hypothetical protein